MAPKRYAVIDKDGVVNNIIMVDDPMPANYWPGYGAGLISLEGTPVLTRGSGLPVYGVTPDKPLGIGDTINLRNGVVTKFVPEIVPDETDPLVTVASAPRVRMAQDQTPTRDGSNNTLRTSATVKPQVT